MNKKYVKKHDYSRILLTELFPYEVPLVFNVEGWKKYCYEVKDLFIESEKRYYIPFNYEIRKGENEFRTLSLIHPLQCKDFIDFYKKYGSYIIYLCNKQTKISLRYPTRITNAYHSGEAKHHSGEVIEIDNSEKELIEYVKYFSYKKFDGVYKFYESADYQRLEKKYKCCFICDISKCFYSIYTHTISWAVKTQEIAKKNTNQKDSFDWNFDKLMQKSNFNETHGIIVGPEISRIFAEIILQKIDRNIIQELSNENVLIDRDYVIRRYVDDYFIFYNDDNIFNYIYKVLQKCLWEYKLSINESKSDTMKNPFITKNTIAKAKLSSLISDNLQVDKIDGLKFNDAQKIITQIKTIVSDYAISYSSVVNYLLATIDKKIIEYINKEKAKTIVSTSSIYDGMEVLFSVYFFLYNMDIRVDTSYRIAYRILETLKEIKIYEDIIDNFLQFIIKELEQCYERIKNIRTTNNISIEYINYVYTLLAIKNYCKNNNKQISFDYHFDKLFFNKEKGKITKEYFNKLNYFEIIVFIQTYNENNKKMSVLKEYLVNYFSNIEIEQNAEAFYLFIDIQSCPYTCFDEEFKKNIFIEISKKCINARYIKDFNLFQNELGNGKYTFIEWELNLDNILYRLLTKKAKLHYDR